MGRFTQYSEDNLIFMQKGDCPQTTSLFSSTSSTKRTCFPTKDAALSSKEASPAIEYPAEAKRVSCNSDRNRGFSQNAVTPASLLRFNIRPIVGRKNNDWFIFPYDFTNPSDNLDPIHIGHQPVNDINLKFIMIFFGKSRSQNCFIP